jgi:hypothetical protein
MVGAIYLVVANEFKQTDGMSLQIPEPLWKRFRNALDWVGAEFAGAEALAAPRPSCQG